MRHILPPGPVTVKSRSITAALAGVAKLLASIIPTAPAISVPLNDELIVESPFHVVSVEAVAEHRHRLPGRGSPSSCR